jgi:heterodisulfide reductase subunit A-like polyferredoxin
MYGLLENYYRKAREKNILFLRYPDDRPPTVETTDGTLRISLRDCGLKRDVRISPDILVLSAGMRAEETEELASIMKLGVDEDGFLMESHVKLRPVEMATDGIFVCGTAHGPKLISESISQAMAAVSRAATFLSKSEITLSTVNAKVDQDKCAACLVCVMSCPYGVPRINKDGVSEIDEALCRGCGVCAAECPAKAIELNWYEDDQILCKVDALLEGVL